MTTKPQITPYPIRMQPELREALESAAEQGGRSLHAEIIQRLERSIAPVDHSAFQVYADGDEPDHSAHEQYLEQQEIAYRAAEAVFNRSKGELTKLFLERAESKDEDIHQAALKASTQVLQVFKLIDPETKKTLESIDEFNKNLRNLDIPALQSFSQIAQDMKRKLDEQHEKEMELIKKLSSQSASDILQEKIDQIEAQRSTEKESLKKRP